MGTSKTGDWARLSCVRSAGLAETFPRRIATCCEHWPVTPSSLAFASALRRVSRASAYRGSARSVSAARYSFRCSAFSPPGNGLLAMA